MTNVTPEEREVMRKLGRKGGLKGGRSTSEAKKKASRENIKKANEARLKKHICQKQ